MSELAAASLDGIALLRPLSPVERAAVARQCRWRRYAAGDLVLDQEGEGRDVCFVVDGRVRVLNHAASGREISFDDIPAGGLVGEMAAIDGQPRSASVVAVVDGTVIAHLAAAPFRALATGRPDLALAVMQRLAGIGRRTTERVMELSTLGANNRVHAELLRLARRAAAAGAAVPVIDPAPVHGDIAARVSTTRETVARVLGDLARDGVVERRGHALVIRDPARLEAMVEQVRGGV
ncbi:Crp/Fnr family transcriptional regulator [Azospirillum sp. A39]|uniref:Crp/Fnr family transcriptional regulator n=1 Tax=Azospirillum sp. A39 TaxID=3462279 RepID=UPI0040453C7C